MGQIWQQKLDKNWTDFPKLRHNLWITFEDEPDTTYLRVSHAKFEVPTEEARTFLKMRPFCTGHHSLEEIITHGGVPLEKGRNIFNTLSEAGVTRPAYRPFEQLTPDDYRDVLLGACRIWSEQIAETNIGVDIIAGNVSRNVVIGWLLETYHYVKAFLSAIQVAADHSDGQLRDILATYAAQERGHETFMAASLEAVGISRQEVESSIPLVSTRLIDLLMRELFARTPSSALLLAAIVEANELNEDETSSFKTTVCNLYGFRPDALDPLVEHMSIDDQLGYSTMAVRHRDLICVHDEDELHHLVNALHDIKHALDLQKLEIKDYYSHPGSYIPRQFVDFFAV